MNDVTNHDSTTDIRTALAAAQKQLQAGQLQEALQSGQELLKQDPENIEVLYLLAVCQRYQKQPQESLKTLAKLLEINPNYGRAYQEQGHNLKLTASHKETLAAYEKAVKHNPALHASWRELIHLYRIDKNQQGLNLAESEYQRLSKLPKELITVSSLIHEEKLYQAEQICRAFLKKNKTHVEGMRLLADLGMRQYVYDDAEFLLEHCVKFEPNNWLARHDYVTILHKRQKFEQALEQAEYLCKEYPGNIAFETSLASQHVSLGRHEQALEIYAEVIKRNPQLEMPHLMVGHALKTIGRVEEGIQAYKRAYQARSDFGDAYWSLANLKTYRFEDTEIQQMKELIEKSSTTLIDKFHICFALGKAYEDRKDYQQSFQYYEQGNQLKKSQLRYNADILDEALKKQSQVCNQEFFSKTKGYGSNAKDPIFIVGLPRVGSTLLEQILASHSQVDGTMELPNMIALAHKLNGRRMQTEESRYPQILTELGNDDFKQFADDFIRDTQCYREGAPYFIDKMPNNFRHIGLIHCMFPNAKIIDARRHPMACCFSGFKQLFADGQEFTCGLEEIARYYKSYVALMDHWDQVLPGRVLRVHYEHVVADLETQVRRILDYCELPFEQACLDFYKTERSVRTPSSEQVRQPIYKQGVEQWQNYEPYLGTLKDYLADEIASYPMP
ncbi:sulfotransferase [Dasania sp. GY-MA-18]|uniref:Sulfotransferase n=1 Tax=Dasania phycosphaerae TaxID=2950436 RepID=A0A9J6RJV5_9GAMM|nr:MULTISPECIES: tetratricopeptide repeat-containing sulfotransferase family protein [Dasania]MCR8922084.1 sulfotransferase [Dasania sp. GY-MA-18]MCZ0864512.1 sulfotransferase [Dasania phycosphaerae]MCZ0868240.1 sulfotransferase [Dasania phycosphaerae]